MKTITLSISLLFISIFALAQDTLKVLAIGNSFSVDAVEYLGSLAEAANKPLIVANAQIGGCSLERHVREATENKNNYQYIKTSFGKKSDAIKTNLKHCLEDELWDIVVVQQQSAQAGKEETFYPVLADLISYVNKNCLNKKVEIAFHQTWAYSKDSKNKRFYMFDHSQEKMYKALVKAIKKVTKDHNIDIIIPSGTGIQNGRTTSYGDNLCRDGYHLHKIHGRYLAGCVWLETFFPGSVLGNSYYPEPMSKEQVLEVQKSAIAAVKKPWKVTKIK